jgi:DNA-binding CsgD family transcriptional regulator
MKLLAESAEGAGYLLKDRISDVKEFISAVERVAAGGSAIDPNIVSTLLSKRRSDDPLDQLTPREREVLELMAEGRSNQGIADKLVISLRAVEKYVSSIFGKLGLPRAERLAPRSRRAPVPARLTRARRQKPSLETASLPPSARRSQLRGSIDPAGREESDMKTRVFQDEPDEPTGKEHDLDPVDRGGR